MAAKDPVDALTRAMADLNFDAWVAKRRPIAEQIASLDERQAQCFAELKAYWEEQRKKKPSRLEYSDEMILLFARCSPGNVKFNAKASRGPMLNFSKWASRAGLYNLTIQDVRYQLETECLSIPGVRDVDGNLVLYMKPALYTPKKDSLDELMRSLIYLLQRMTEDEHCATVGLTFMANMEGWGWSNWSVNYARNFFNVMMGRFPQRVRRFLIVNPPGWFGAVWAMIRQMISSEFAAKVAMPKREGVTEFLAEDALPTVMGGKVDYSDQLQKFIRHRYKVEGLDYDAPYGPKDGGADGTTLSAEAAGEEFPGEGENTD